MTDYTTPCPLHDLHRWTILPWASNRSVHRFACPCGAMAWREGKPGTPIRQYAPDSIHAKRAREVMERATLKPPTVTAGPTVGRNETGHRLPASAPVRRRGYR